MKLRAFQNVSKVMVNVNGHMKNVCSPNIWHYTKKYMYFNQKCRQSVSYCGWYISRCSAQCQTTYIYSINHNIQEIII